MPHVAIADFSCTNNACFCISKAFGPQLEAVIMSSIFNIAEYGEKQLLFFIFILKIVDMGHVSFQCMKKMYILIVLSPLTVCRFSNQQVPVVLLSPAICLYYQCW